MDSLSPDLVSRVSQLFRSLTNKVLSLFPDDSMSWSESLRAMKRGSGWAAIILLPLYLVVFLSVLTVAYRAQNGDLDWFQLIQATQVFTFAILSSALGISVGLSSTNNNFGLIETTTLSLEVFPVPLLSLLIIIASATVGRRISRGVPSRPFWTGFVGVVSFATTALLVVLVQRLLTERYAWDLVFALNPQGDWTPKGLTSEDLVTFITFVLLPGLMGSLAESRGRVSPHADWLLKTLRSFALVSLALSVFAIALYVPFRAIAVSFVPVEGPTLCESISCTSATLIGSSVILTLLLPALFIGSLITLIGVPASFTLEGGFLTVLPPELLNLNGMLWTEQSYQLLNLIGTVLLAFVALFAAAVASRAVGFRRAGWRMSVALLSIAIVIGLVLSRVLSSAVLATSEGYTARAPDLESEFGVVASELLGLRFGFNELLLVLASVGFFGLFFVGCRIPNRWLWGLFPRLSALAIFRRDRSSFETEGRFLPLSRRVILGVAAAAVLALFGSASVERLLVLFSGPKQFAGAYADSFSKSTFDETKSFFVEEGAEWLPDEFMRKSFPPQEDPYAFELRDFNGQSFSLNELDGFISVTTPGMSEQDAMRARVPFEGQVQDHFIGVQTARYEAFGVAPEFSVKIPQILIEAGVSAVSLNGFELKENQTVRVLPGEYHLEAPGSGFIAPIDRKVMITQGMNVIELEADLLLNEEMNTQVQSFFNESIERCSNFDDETLASECFSVTPETASTAVSGEPPEDFYSQEVSSLPEVTEVTCTDPNATLTTTSQFTSEITCDFTISFEKTYYDTVVSRTPNIVQRTRYVPVEKCRKYTSSYTGRTYWFSCNRAEEYEVQDGWITSTSRGDPLFTEMFQFEEKLQFDLAADLRSDGEGLIISSK